MKRKLFSIILIFLLSSPSWSETLTIDDLVERDDLYYKKFTNVPFTGEISGIESGSFKNGKREGKWEKYRSNGQLSQIITYIDGGNEKIFEHYDDNGLIFYQGKTKNGKLDGTWIWYFKNGKVEFKGNYKEGKKEGVWEYFSQDGSLKYIVNFKDGIEIE